MNYFFAANSEEHGDQNSEVLPFNRNIGFVRDLRDKQAEVLCLNGDNGCALSNDEIETPLRPYQTHQTLTI